MTKISQVGKLILFLRESRQFPNKNLNQTLSNLILRRNKHGTSYSYQQRPVIKQLRLSKGKLKRYIRQLKRLKRLQPKVNSPSIA